MIGTDQLCRDALAHIQKGHPRLGALEAGGEHCYGLMVWAAGQFEAIYVKDDPRFYVDLDEPDDDEGGLPSALILANKSRSARLPITWTPGAVILANYGRRQEPIVVPRYAADAGERLAEALCNVITNFAYQARGAGQ